MVEVSTPKILTNLCEMMGGPKAFCKAFMVNSLVLRGWRRNGYTYSAAARVHYELQCHIEELQQASKEFDLILKSRRRLVGYRFPPEFDKTQEPRGAKT